LKRAFRKIRMKRRQGTNPLVFCFDNPREHLTIIQNGKLVGATTHVFVSDPTKGYGIYADWMAAQ
ncbi:MAG: hypothetical protein IJ959_01160, partial [Clostridia bacterium]|nr:hypothetical protein [Clostridia bacterium]